MRVLTDLEAEWLTLLEQFGGPRPCGDRCYSLYTPEVERPCMTLGRTTGRPCSVMLALHASMLA